MISKGFLYVAGGLRYIQETELALKQLANITNLPICVIIDEEFDLSFKHPNILIKKINNLKEFRYSSKIIGLQHSPFEQTIYMDSDTYAVENIDHLFKLFDLVDLFLPYEPNAKSHDYTDDFSNLVPELNSGVIGIKRNSKTDKFLQDWLQALQLNSYNTTLDMPYMRQAYIQNITDLSIHVLPERYNMHGLSSLKIIHGKVYLIHERFGYFKKSTSKYMKNNEFMKKIANGINKRQTKRLYLPFLNISIPTSYIAFDTYVVKFRKLLRFKRMSKRDLILRDH